MTISALHQLLHQDPAFGYDPWLGPAPAPGPVDAAAVPVDAAAVFYGEDTIGQDIGLLNPGQSLYATYVPPSTYAGWVALVAWAKTHAPTAFLLSITTSGARARCGDFEPGAMATAGFAHWYDNEAIHDDLSVPWGYTSASNMQALIDAAAGRKFIRFSAHYGFGYHICGPGTCGYPQADWTQCFDIGPAGQNFDRSIGRILPQPAPTSPSGIARALLEIDIATCHGTLTEQPGSHIAWGETEQWISKEIQLCRGGPQRGQWRMAGLPFGALPLGTRELPSENTD